MRIRALAFAVAAILASAAAALAAGAAYVVRSPSAGLFERPGASEASYTLVKDQIITVLQRRGEWFRIITEEGEEGWVRESALAALPAGAEEESMISEASPDDVEEAVYYDFVVGKKKGNIRRDPRMNAPIVRTAEAGEVFSIVVESEGWFQVAREGKVEGWMHNSVGEKRKSQNLALRMASLVEGKLAWFDQAKNEDNYFRRAGWFPSLFLRDSENDIVVEKASMEGKKAVTVHLAYARRDIEYRMVISSADRFTLPGANRMLFADLMLSAIAMFPEIESISIKLWFAELEVGGRLSWRSKGKGVLTAGRAKSISRQGNVADAVWSALETNTIPDELWRDSVYGGSQTYGTAPP